MNKRTLLFLIVGICLIGFVSATSIDLDWIYPTSNINVEQNEFFNVSVNVSCLGGNCGEINVTLDPASEESLDFEDFEDDNWAFSKWKNVAGDDFDWTLDEGGTTSTDTGPGSANNNGHDHTLDTTLGIYAYIETSSPNYPNKQAILEYNESIDADLYDVNLTFWYLLHGVTVGCLTVDINDSSGWNNDIWKLCGEQHGTGDEDYDFGSVDLSSYEGEINIRIRANSTSSFSGDIAIDDISINYTSGSAKSGTVSMDSTATPFYTNITNPYNLTLNQDESQVITWYVNATGTIDNPYEFFIYANQTADLSISNTTSIWNITIKDTTFPIVNITYPTNSSYDISVDSLNYTYSDINEGYCWYTKDNGVTNSSVETAGTNFTGLSSSGGSNTWILYCNDSSGNEVSDLITFTSTIPVIGLNVIYPTGGVNVTQNEFFEVRVNVSCSNNNCGALNVTLDPAESFEHYDDFESDFGYWDYQEHVNCRAGSDPWRRSTSTGSSGTGPLGGVGGSGTYFIYVETSSGDCYDSGDVALIYFNTSIDYDSYANEKIEFSFHAYGAYIDDLYLEENSTGSWTKIWEMHDINVNSWNFTNVSLSDLTGSGSLRFNYTRTSTYFTSDIALDRINVTYSTGTKSGIISTDPTATPFYTNITNPYNLTLNQDKSEIITWWVNATGDADEDTTHLFFIYANQTADESISDITASWNVTIVNFTVDNTAPTTTLISPIDNSGQSQNISFNYNVTDANNVTSCSFKLNEIVNQTNTTITKDITQNFTLNNLAVGSYNYSVNCSDNSGNIGTSETRSFSVIKEDDFAGDTTDLTQEDITNITNLIIESPSYGQINFTENVDLSSGADIDEYVSISQNRIEINSTALSALNVSARLKLYGLTFTTPQILKDGVLCGSACVQESYVSATGILTFNVTSFSVYSARETPTTSDPADTGGDTGGGGGGIIYECTKDSDCETGYSCYNHKCVKLFDIKILEIQPLIDELSFELEYLIKGMANISGDVIVKFWIEDENKNQIMLGQDAIYFGSFEEKIKTTTLNLPYDVLDEAYDLYVQVNFENYNAESFRKINLKIDKEKRLIAEMELAEQPPKGIYWILILIIGFVLIVLFWIEIKKIKRKITKKSKQEVEIVQKSIDKTQENVSEKSVGFIHQIKKSIKNIKKSKLKIPKISFAKKTKYVFNNPCLSTLSNKKVYSSDGKYIGKTKQAILKDNRIYGWIIQPDKKYEVKKDILIQHKDVVGIKEIFIVDERIEDYLEKRG